MRYALSALLLISACATTTDVQDPDTDNTDAAPFTQKDGERAVSANDIPGTVVQPWSPSTRGDPGANCRALATDDPCCVALVCDDKLPSGCETKPGTCIEYACLLEDGAYTMASVCPPL